MINMADVDLKTNSPGRYTSKNKLNDLTGKEWIQLTKSFWMQNGLGASHPHAKIEQQHPAPFGFKDISKMITFFTKNGDIVLDPFSGVGSTAKACALTGRKSVGIELSKKWAELSTKRLIDEVGSCDGQKIIIGDSRVSLKQFNDSFFDFIITSPPYWQILTKKTDLKSKERVEKGLDKKYSEDEKDLGNIDDYPLFLEELKKVFSECYRVLKNKKYTVVVVSDFRHKSRFIPYHLDVITLMNDIGFKLEGITILVQNHKGLKPYGYPYAFVSNIHHQYFLIFRKETHV